MFGISGAELALIVVFILIIFGPDKLPELARTFGKAMRTFKNAQEDMERLIKAEMVQSDKAEQEKVAAEAEPAKAKAAAQSQAAAIWEATESDDEEEDEE